MSDYSPPGSGNASPFTLTAASTITGGTLVEGTTTPGQVQATTAASSKVVGVAAHDAGANQRVSIWPLPGVVHEITASGTVTSGDNVVSAANGQAATGALALGTALGTAVSTATTGNRFRFVGR